jgi:tRNA (guanine37-N1)-methyltransferase
MQCCVITLFPDMFPSALGYSVTGSALEKGLWSLTTIDLREHAHGKHRLVDDTPYGGGAGMVMRPDVVASAIDAARAQLPEATLIHLTPRGKVLQQADVTNLMQSATPRRFIFLCGRFEGVDQRVLDAYQPLEISIGDYVLCGGELAAQVMMEAMLRHVEGVLGNVSTHDEESFAIGEENACLLEYPHYTKPPVWNGVSVPEVLTSGNHAHIKAWRRAQSEAITELRRPDLWAAKQTQET